MHHLGHCIGLQTAVDLLDLVDDFLHGLIALLRLLGEALQDDGLQPGGDLLSSGNRG